MRLTFTPTAHRFVRSVLLGEAREHALCGTRGEGKALHPSTPVCTPTGWVKVRDLSVGDTVYAGDGSPTKIVGVYPQPRQALYRLHLSDSTSAVCTDDHLWLIQTMYDRRPRHRPTVKTPGPRRSGTGKVVPFREIREALDAGRWRRGGRWNVPLCAPVAFPKRDVPINPWLLGALLGDGCFRGHASVFLTTASEEMVSMAKAALPPDLELRSWGGMSYGIVRRKPTGLHSMYHALIQLGLHGLGSHGKFIPPLYLWNTPEVRLAVLQGLLDTDGNITVPQATVYYNTVSLQLAEDMRFLVQSLGGIARWNKKQIGYQLTISLPNSLLPFRLSDKLKRVKPKTHYPPRRFILRHEFIGDGEAICIRVEHASGTFLIEDFLVTHNSWTALDAMIEHAIEHGSRIVQSRDGSREGRYRLPVPWVSVTDSFEGHKRKLVKSMLRPEWEGVWRLSDNLHVGTAVLGESPLVRVELFGIEDQGAKSRVRLETCGVHFEEVAPASEELEANGVDEDSWEVALSSQRVVTYCVCDVCKDPAPMVAEDLDAEGFVLGDSRPTCLKCGQEARRVYPALITSNYPDEDHWFWKRFKVDPREGTRLFEIQPGERVSKQERETRAAGISNPVLRDRLYGGKPGSLRRGDPVTGNYQEGRHYSRQLLLPRAGDLWFSWDAWHHPACAIAFFSSLGQLRIPFARRLDNADIGNLIDDYVIPWLARYNLTDEKRFTIHHCGDPTAFTPDQSNREQSAGKVLRKKLPGQWHDSVNDPDLLIRAIRTALGASISTGEPKVLLCGPDAYEGHQALNGGWHLKRDGKPQKHGWEGRHSHVGDALAHLCHTVFGAASRGADMSKWAQQSAYVAPWDGARPDEVSPSPAAGVLARHEDREAYRTKWMKQYRSEP